MNFSFPPPPPPRPPRPRRQIVFRLSPAHHRALAVLLRLHPDHPKAHLAPHHEALARIIEKRLGPGEVGCITPGSHQRFARIKRLIEGRIQRRRHPVRLDYNPADGTRIARTQGRHAARHGGNDERRLL